MVYPCKANKLYRRNTEIKYVSRSHKSGCWGQYELHAKRSEGCTWNHCLPTWLSQLTNPNFFLFSKDTSLIQISNSTAFCVLPYSTRISKSDQIKLRTIWWQCAPCTASGNQPGVLTVFDVFCFQNADVHLEQHFLQPGFWRQGPLQGLWWGCRCLRCSRKLLVCPSGQFGERFNLCQFSWS